MKNDFVYTVIEAAELLGVSRHTAYQAVHAGQIPSIRIGRSIKIPKAKLDEMLEQRQTIAKETQKQIDTQPNILRMPPRMKVVKVPRVQMNVSVSVELNNKLVQSAIDHGVSLRVEICTRLERTFGE